MFMQGDGGSAFFNFESPQERDEVSARDAASAKSSQPLVRFAVHAARCTLKSTRCPCVSGMVSVIVVFSVLARLFLWVLIYVVPLPPLYLESCHPLCKTARSRCWSPPHKRF